MKKSTLLKMLSLALAILCCCGCLLSCSKDGDSTEGTESSDVIQSSGWTLGGGAASFKIVYPKNPHDTVKMALETLLAAFESKTGVRPETSDDYLKKGRVYDISTYEILLGRTKYDQTQDVLGELENGQYAIRVVGKKIVITAPEDADIAAAVDYFITNYINSNLNELDGTYILSVGDYTSEAIAVDNTITINGNNIADYKIIYETERKGYAYAAQMLGDTMAELGYDVAVLPDVSVAETPSAKEILIGKTNRSISKEIYEEEEPNFLTYKVVVDETYLQLVCGGPYSARACVSDMFVRFFNAEDKAFDDGEYFAADHNSKINAITSGTQLRVMTLNVLAQRYFIEGGDNYPVEQRAEVFAAMLLTNQPDIIGLQETDKDWISKFPYYLERIKEDCGIEYTWMFTDFEGRETLTTVLYRSDKYDLLNSGIENASWYTRTDYNIRLYEWVYLAEKENSSHKFILTNTHWSLIEEDGSGQEEFDKMVQEYTDLVNQLKTTYQNVPIFSTGDYNSGNANRSPKNYTAYTNEFLAQTECFDSMLKAAELGVRVNDCAGNGMVGKKRFENAGYSHIDHIACYGSTIEILKYETLTGNNIYMSDHSPHMIDVKLWAN